MNKVDWERKRQIQKAKDGFCPKCNKKGEIHKVGKTGTPNEKIWICLKCELFWIASVYHEILEVSRDENDFRR